MKVAIVGSRDYPAGSLIRRYVESLPIGTTIVSGGARGVDGWAEETAKWCHLDIVSIRPRQVAEYGFQAFRIFMPEGNPADREETALPGVWPNYGACAFARNEIIVQECDKLVAFWNGSSRGTANTIVHARASGKPYAVVGPGGKTIEKRLPEVLA